jgi:hypothetical protein
VVTPDDAPRRVLADFEHDETAHLRDVKRLQDYTAANSHLIITKPGIGQRGWTAAWVDGGEVRFARGHDIGNFLDKLTVTVPKAA